MIYEYFVENWDQFKFTILEGILVLLSFSFCPIELGVHLFNQWRLLCIYFFPGSEFKCHTLTLAYFGCLKGEGII